MKSFIKLQTVLFLNVMAGFSLNCFSGTDLKKEEKLICNKYCQSVERIQINQLNSTEVDLSATKDVIKNIIDKKMKMSGNTGYGTKSDPRPGGTSSHYSKVERDSKRLLNRSLRSNSANMILTTIIFRQNDCDKGAVDVDIRLLASDYMFFDVVKCNGRDAVSCVKAALTDFAENEFTEYLFKEPMAFNL